MSDFRLPLYKNYVSKFKEFYLNSDAIINKSDWVKYRKKILPLLIGYSKNAEILEVGCGSGLLLQYLDHEGYKNLSGIDISEEQVQKAKARGYNVNTADVSDYLKNKAGKYDIIIAYDFIEHFSKEEIYNLAMIIYNSLKSSGIFIIHTPNGQGITPHKIIYGDLTHLTIFTPDSLFQLLNLSGFKNICSVETGPVIRNINSFIRFILWKIIRMIYNLIRFVETGGFEKILTQDFICAAKK